VNVAHFAGKSARATWSARVTWEEMACGEEGFSEVAGDDFFRGADGGEIDARVPA